MAARHFEQASRDEDADENRDDDEDETADTKDDVADDGDESGKYGGDGDARNDRGPGPAWLFTSEEMTISPARCTSAIPMLHLRRRARARTRTWRSPQLRPWESWHANGNKATEGAARCPWAEDRHPRRSCLWHAMRTWQRSGDHRCRSCVGRKGGAHQHVAAMLTLLGQCSGADGSQECVGLHGSCKLRHNADASVLRVCSHLMMVACGLVANQPTLQAKPTCVGWAGSRNQPTGRSSGGFEQNFNSPSGKHVHQSGTRVRERWREASCSDIAACSALIRGHAQVKSKQTNTPLRTRVPTQTQTASPALSPQAAAEQAAEEHVAGRHAMRAGAYRAKASPIALWPRRGSEPAVQGQGPASCGNAEVALQRYCRRG